MKKEKKIVSREIGLEIGSICGKYFLKLDHLHYGYWTDDLKVDITNVHAAQEKYADFLISHIPKGTKNILDVGCGSGHIAKKLTDMGYKVDCVSPSHFLAEQTRQLLGNACHVHECFYEQLQTQNRYDVILFSESFQYIDMAEAFRKTQEFLNPGGFMLICDYFKKDTPEKSYISGGHPLQSFYNTVAQHPFTLIEDLDITPQTAPNLDVLNDTFTKAVYPTVMLTRKLMENRYPLASKIVSWLYRRKINKIHRKYFQGEKTGQQFMKFKSYRLLLYKKTISDSTTK
jgi:2-polyprenyl-3-methyl-5-hydroxy-6-metoxy-1,4-benzoquinol methylase